jgi:copper chaperone
MTSKTFLVPAIHCQHCVRTIERELGELDGVAEVKADEATKQVTVSWNEAEVDWDSIQALLEEIGYPPEQ